MPTLNWIGKEAVVNHHQQVPFYLLKDECRGKDRYDNTDSEEKRAIGAVWATRSGGRCLFEMPTDVDFSGVIKAVKPAAHC